MKRIIYKNWFITYNPKPVPLRAYDYDAVHEDYGGDTFDENDKLLALVGGSVDELKAIIDGLEVVA